VSSTPKTLSNVSTIELKGLIDSERSVEILTMTLDGEKLVDAEIFYDRADISIEQDNNIKTISVEFPQKIRKLRCKNDFLINLKKQA
jgi:acetolactate synthase regulatory subunit